MTTYLAFLRAINLGPTHPFPKDDIRRVVESAGFTGVQTHINTGNVRLDAEGLDRVEVEDILERAFAADRGFDVPTIAFDTAEFAAIARDAGELGAARPGLARHYVYLLKSELSEEEKDAVESASGPAGDMVVRGRAAHALLGPAYRAGNVDPLGAAKLLGVTTSRNATVVSAIAQKWAG